MNQQNEKTLGTWGHRLIQNLLHPLTIFGAPAFILCLLIYFLFRNFRLGLAPGIRSFAGVLLPLIVASFLFAFQRHLLERLGNLGVLTGFLVSSVVGFLLLLVVRIIVTQAAPLPISELVLSSAFSVLVFGYVSLPAEKVLCYFYGAVTGFLVHIVFLGWPL